MGHYARVCKSEKEVREMKPDEQSDDDVYTIRIFRVTNDASGKKELVTRGDFKAQIVINNCLDYILADTGARVSVCNLKDAKRWGIHQKMQRSKTRIKPYNSPVIPTIGVARCDITFGDRLVPVLWHIIEENCEPVLAGAKAEQLGIIKFSSIQPVFAPVNMIVGDTGRKAQLQDILQRHSNSFQGIGKLTKHQVKLHVKEEVKPILSPQRPVPYHLKSRIQEQITEMLSNDIIEEHPVTEPSPRVSNMVVAPKSDGEIRITLNTKNVNRALESSNLPIPRHEEIKTQLSGCKFFSKLDLKSAFWQLEISPSSRYLTVFTFDGKLYRYKRLSMGLKPVQGKLNAALRPILADISQTCIA